MAAVPASDLPNNAVPAGDLPDHLNAPSGPQGKSDFGGAAKTFGLSAAKEGLRTTGAIAGGELGAESGAALGSFGGPLGTIAGGVLGGIGGGALGYLGMGKLGDRATAGTAKETAAHPTASALGRAAVDIPMAGAGVYQLGRAVIPALAKGPIGKSVLGVPSRATEEIAKAFEKRGYKLEPAQLKADVPSKSPGFMGNRVANQTLANKEASAATGAEAGGEGITDKFLSSRFGKLSDGYDKLLEKYPGWSIDRQTYDDLGHLIVTEEHTAQGQVRPVEKIAGDIRNEWQAAQKKFPGQQITSFKMDATKLKRYMTELKRVARMSSDGTDKYAAGQAIQAITNSLGRSQPALAKDLSTLNQQYRSTIALDELLKGGGIRGGNISLSQLGNRLNRLEGNPLYDLGLGGRELNLAARWEGAGPSGKSFTPESLLSPTKLARTLGTGMGLRSQAARNVQRKFTGD